MGDELRDHLEQQIQVNLEKGMSKEKARRAALLALGGMTQIDSSAGTAPASERQVGESSAWPRTPVMRAWSYRSGSCFARLIFSCAEAAGAREFIGVGCDKGSGGKFLC